MPRLPAEDLLLAGAFLASVVALALAVRARMSGQALPALARRLVWVTAALLSVSLLLLLSYFLLERLGVEYVHSYTSTDTPWYYRVAGLWAGQKGTVLLWATTAAWVLAINDSRWRRKEALPETHERAATLLLVVGLLVLVAFEGLLLLQGTFEATDPYLQRLSPEGRGLQPVLLTPFMIIHPPLQFVAYAVAVLLFAAGVTGIVSREAAWADLALPWARVGFLISTIGLGLGGLWAYYVLNFGGYWAWDPVETANLLAWFPMLLLVHALLYYRKRRMYEASAPLFASLTLIMALFSTIATRTGLWVSVHAFTDPSKNFASDPLARLLNILETSLILQWLTSMFLAAILGLLLAYFLRLAQDARSEGRSSARLHGAAAGVLAAAIALAFLDVGFAASALFEAADVIGFDRAPIGLAVLGFLAALVVAAPAAPEKPKPATPAPFLDRYVQTPQLVFVGVLLLSLAFLVTFLLDVLSVNGYQRQVYDDRAPLVALPILLVMGIALGHPVLGRKNAVLAAGAAGLVGVVAALANPAHWQVSLVLPALAWALLGASLKLFKVADLGRMANVRVRAAGGLLLAGGVTTMVYWSNPPSRIALLGWQPSAWLAPVGFLLGLVAFLSSVGVLRVKTVRAHRVGAAALLLGWGFGLGPVLGAVVWWLGETRRRDFPDHGAPMALRSCVASLRREVRKSGTYLIHVAVVLGMAGYAFSTYEAPEEAGVELALGETQEALGYVFRFSHSRAGPIDSEQGQLSEVSAMLEVRRGGDLVGSYPLTMWLELRQHYAERVTVLRESREDVYLRPVRFATPERNFTAHEDQVVLQSGRVDAVAFTVKVLPGMHLVWGGLWMIGAGMLVILFSGGARFEVSSPKTAGD